MSRKRSDNGETREFREKRASFLEHDMESSSIDDIKKDEEQEEKATEEGQGSLEYMRVEDVFIVPAVGTYQEDFDLDGQEYCLSCCTTPRPTMCDSTLLGRKRKQMICPNCLARIKTYIDHGFKKRALGHSWVVPFVGFCCALYAIPCFHTVRHYCPQCRVFLGQRRGMLSVKERAVEDREAELITKQEYVEKSDLEEEVVTQENVKERKKIRSVREKMTKRQERAERKTLKKINKAMKQKAKKMKKKEASIVLEEISEKADIEHKSPGKSKDDVSIASGEELQERHNRRSAVVAKGVEPGEASTAPAQTLQKTQETESLPQPIDLSEISLVVETPDPSKGSRKAARKSSKISQGTVMSKKDERGKERSKSSMKSIQLSKGQFTSEPSERPREPSRLSRVPESSEQQKVEEYPQTQEPTVTSEQAAKESATEPSSPMQVAPQEMHSQKPPDPQGEPTEGQGETKEETYKETP